MKGRLSLVSNTGTVDRAWNYSCRCGLEYRVADDGVTLRYRVRSGAASFGRRSIPAGTPCLRCGARLAAVALVTSTAPPDAA